MRKQVVRRMSRKVASLLAAAAVAFTSIPFIMSPGSAEGSTVNGNEYVNYGLLDEMQDASILHCWNWSYKTIEENLELIAQCGYSAVQTSPAQQPKDYTYDGLVGTDVGTPGQGGSGNWWKLYQPVTFSVCDNGETWLGTKAELESLCAKAEEYGIKIIVDIVANHMGNIKGWSNSLADVSEQVGRYWNPDMLTNEEYWHINDLQVWMSDGREDITQGSMGMPDLNTANKTVQRYVAAYLNELIDCGVDGFRFDAAKHIETPDDDSKFASDFWPTVINSARQHYREVTGGELYVYGEILNMVGDNFNIGSYTKYMSVTDNSAGNQLLEAYRHGNIGTISMHYSSDKAVLWAESHDTYMNESSRYASDKSILRTWAMVANKDNAAALFFVRPYYSYQILENDVDDCMQSDLSNLVQAQMGECPTYIWASNEVAAINHFNNRFHNYTEEVYTEGNIAINKRSNGMVLINFGGAGDVSVSSHGMADGVYTDEVSGNTFTVANGTISGKIESEYGIAVVYKNVMPNPNPVYPAKVSANIGDGSVFYTDGLTVTINVSNATSGQYEASTGEKGSLSNGQNVITIGKGLAKGETVTLTVKAANSQGEKEAAYTYTKDEYDLTDCIFVKNTKGWDNVTTYMWNANASGVKNAAWPGEKMYCCDTANNVYAVKVDTSAQYTNIIFSNAGSAQTNDLAMGQIGYMYDLSNGTWTEYRADDVKTPEISASGSSTAFTGKITVEYTVKNAQSATITVNGVKESFTDTITKTFTKDTTVVIEAINENKSATKTYTYTRKYEAPTVSVTDSTTFTDTIEVTVSENGAAEAYYQINDGSKAAFSGTKTITIGADMAVGDKAVVTVTAKNADGEATPATAAFEKIEKISGSYIYLNVNSCSWFGNDSAVAAIKTNLDSVYTKMSVFTNTAGEKLYYYEVPSEATTVTIVRMLPSGKCYNEKTFTVNAGNDYFVSDGNWSGVSSKLYTGSKPSGEINPPVYETPVITFTKDSGTYTEDITVTITVKNAQSAAYSLNNGTQVSFNNSVTLNISASTKVAVTAVNGDKSASAAKTYTINKPVSDMITVYFANNNNWSKVYAYTWGGSKKTAAWPGDAMTYVDTNQYNQAVYKITISADIKGIIFTNGTGNQTVDITKVADGMGFYLSEGGSKCNVGTYTYGD